MISDLTLGFRPSGRGAAFVGGHLKGSSQRSSSIELRPLSVNLIFEGCFDLTRFLFFLALGRFLLPARIFDLTLGCGLLVLGLVGRGVVVVEVEGRKNSLISSTYSGISPVSGLDVLTGICGLLVNEFGREVVKNVCSRSG